MIIYKITNQINNKVYIGLTTCSLEYRWSRHITESKNINNTKHLYKSMRKYGIKNFIIEEIEFLMKNMEDCIGRKVFQDFQTIAFA